MRPYYFISGLPRSGSTLLSAILKQNPDIHAGMSSPVLGLISALQKGMSNANEYGVFINDERRRNVLRGFFDNYYASVPQRIIFDTNRAWSHRLSTLLQIFPDAKVICCVRPILEIIDSIERLHAASPLQLSRMFNFDPDINIYGRVEKLMSQSGLVGSTLSGLRDACHGPYSEHLLLVSYEALASDPKETIQQIYDFIGEGQFDHNFENVAFNADEFDQQFGLPGLHRVAQKVSYTRRPVSLPPDIIARNLGQEFWMSPDDGSKAHRISHGA